VFHYAPDSDEIAATPSTYRMLQITDAPAIVLDVNVVSSNYFDVIGLPILAGQRFGAQKHACRVAIVNQQAADRYFGGDAVGGAVIDSEGTRTTIIGVVGSTKLRAAQRDVPPTLYLPQEQDVQPRMTMILETEAISRATLRRLHQRLAQIAGGRDDRITVDTLDRHLSRTAFAPERIATVLVGASAALSLILGLLGLYGVMSDAARRRRREFALRIALGAQPPQLIGQVVAEGLRLVVAGALAGAAASFVVARWVSHVTPATDGPPLTVWLTAPILLAIAVGIASVLPARNALATDPLLIMRSE
jgi:ABC-type antimicrobial peptide transport system permease subunit